jgi:hypothetical protein|tara:strand:+ start:272 stop:478 length:207 start_codon:yes stop_codon:yes gene_type:complete
MEELDKMNSYVSLHNVSDAKVYLRQHDGYEVISLKLIDPTKEHMELTIFSEGEKFPANVLKVFEIKRD